MTLGDIEIGTRLELVQINSNNEEVGQTYASQLLDRYDNNLLVISAPISAARLVFIALQSRLRLIFLHSGLGLFGFTAIVTASEFMGKLAVLIVQPECEPESIQRRSFYRLSHLADAMIWLTEEVSNLNPAEGINAFTKNISGSGVCIVTEHDIPCNSIISVKINLDETASIIAKCIVMRNTMFEVRKTRKYELGLRFTEIQKKDQEHLVKFIFEKQRETLLRGKKK